MPQSVGSCRITVYAYKKAMGCSSDSPCLDVGSFRSVTKTHVKCLWSEQLGVASHSLEGVYYARGYLTGILPFKQPPVRAALSNGIRTMSVVY